MKDSETKTEVTPAVDEDAQLIELSRQPIELYKILKFEGLVGSGGEAKAAIAGGHVFVNGVLEIQKRKKIVSGDTIRFDDKLFRMHCDAPPEPVVPRTEKKAPVKKVKKKDWRKRTVSKKRGRKTGENKTTEGKSALGKGGERKAIGIKSKNK